MAQLFVILVGFLIVDAIKCSEESSAVVSKSADEGVSVSFHEDLSRPVDSSATADINTGDLDQSVEGIEPKEGNFRRSLNEPAVPNESREPKPPKESEPRQESFEAERKADKTVSINDPGEVGAIKIVIERVRNRPVAAETDTRYLRSNEEVKEDNDSKTKGDSREELTDTVENFDNETKDVMLDTKGRTASASSEVVGGVSSKSDEVMPSDNLRSVDNVSPKGRLSQPYQYASLGRDRFQKHPGLVTPVSNPYKYLNKPAMMLQQIGNRQFDTEDLSRSSNEIARQPKHMDEYNPNSNAYPYEPVELNSIPPIETKSYMPPLTYNMPPIETVTYRPPMETVTYRPPMETVTYRSPMETVPYRPPMETVPYRPPMETVTYMPQFDTVTYMPQFDTVTFMSQFEPVTYMPPQNFGFNQPRPPIKNPLSRENFYPDNLFANKFFSGTYNYNPYGISRNIG